MRERGGREREREIDRERERTRELCKRQFHTQLILVKMADMKSEDNSQSGDSDSFLPR